MRRAFRYDCLMFVRLRHLLGWVVSAFRSREEPLLFGLSFRGELLLENLALRQQLLALYLASREPGLRLGGRSDPAIEVMLLFSACSRLHRWGPTQHCSQICNWNFHKDQQPSTTWEMQPADFRELNLYTRKVTHLIPNQIPMLGETC